MDRIGRNKKQNKYSLYNIPVPLFLHQTPNRQHSIMYIVNIQGCPSVPLEFHLFCDSNWYGGVSVWLLIATESSTSTGIEFRKISIKSQLITADAFEPSSWLIHLIKKLISCFVLCLQLVRSIQSNRKSGSLITNLMALCANDFHNQQKLFNLWVFNVNQVFRQLLREQCKSFTLYVINGANIAKSIIGRGHSASSSRGAVYTKNI